MAQEWVYRGVTSYTYPPPPQGLEGGLSQAVHHHPNQHLALHPQLRPLGRDHAL
jgi:hypothetical protein